MAILMIYRTKSLLNIPRFSTSTTNLIRLLNHLFILSTANKNKYVIKIHFYFTF